MSEKKQGGRSSAGDGRPTVRAALHTLSTLVSKDWFQAREPDAIGVYYASPKRAGIPPRCDAWRGKNDSGVSVFLVHGGGFLIGHRRMKAMRLLATHYAAQGAHVCSVDYRMVFRGGHLDTAVSDVADALNWWADDPLGWGVNPSKIAVIAVSAGAALALLATGSQTVPVARMAGVFGIYDFRTLKGRLAGWIARKLVGSNERDTLAQHSPCYSAQPDAPLLLLHGTEDALVPVEQAYALEAVRSEKGLVTTLSIFDGAPHAFLNWQGPHAIRALRELDAFFAPILSQSSESEAA